MPLCRLEAERVLLIVLGVDSGGRSLGEIGGGCGHSDGESFLVGELVVAKIGSALPVYLASQVSVRVVRIDREYTCHMLRLYSQRG